MSDTARAQGISVVTRRQLQRCDLRPLPCGSCRAQAFDEHTPMAHLRHISIFHLISAGECSVELATGERRKVSAGDILLMPFADTHKFWNGHPKEHVVADDVVRPGPLKGMWNINHGGGGNETRVVCG